MRPMTNLTDSNRFADCGTIQNVLWRYHELARDGQTEYLDAALARIRELTPPPVVSEEARERALKFLSPPTAPMLLLMRPLRRIPRHVPNAGRRSTGIPSVAGCILVVPAIMLVFNKLTSRHPLTMPRYANCAAGRASLLGAGAATAL